MSADNWARCPFCVKAAREAFEADAAAVSAAYGVVPAAEYEAMLAGLGTFDPWSVKETLREDWELGFREDPDEDPVAILRYWAHCSACGANAKVHDAITLTAGGAA